MENLGNGIFIFGLVRLVISFVNWVSRLYLPEKYHLKGHPSVSILIPARNEAENIENLLEDLLTINYPSLEIWVYDDSSTDNTADIVLKYASLHSHIHLLEGKPLPDGWMGKNFACYQLASVATGEKLLFLDADVRVRNEIIEKSLFYIDKYRLKLLSVFPTQIMPTTGSRMVVPIMNWILLSLLPLPLIRLSKMVSLSAANGQYMFFDADEYHRIEPHRLFRSNQVEDIAILKEYKRRRMKSATLLGADDIYCRMYSELQEGIDGFSKNVFQFFGGSRLLTVLFAMVTTIAPFYLFVFNGYIYGLIYLLFIILIRVFVSLSSHQPVAGNLLLLVPQQFVFWKIIISAFVKSKNKNLLWKGRNISSVS
ncbi:MAG TPA: glycosyl transferase family 2 [Dysgonomonas sp.]|nr:glycosyl transferase family 2 [Dysgonomonas sp.]